MLVSCDPLGVLAAAVVNQRNPALTRLVIQHRDQPAPVLVKLAAATHATVANAMEEWWVSDAAWSGTGALLLLVTAQRT